MKIPHHMIMDQDGNTVGVVLSVDKFREIQSLLGDRSSENSFIPSSSASHVSDNAAMPASEATEAKADLPEKTAEHVEGGDFKPLNEIGITLPKAKKRKLSADEDEEGYETEEEKRKREAIDGIRIGKRIK